MICSVSVIGDGFYSAKIKENDITNVKNCRFNPFMPSIVKNNNLPIWVYIYTCYIAYI